MRQRCFAGQNARFLTGRPMTLLVATGRFAGPVVEVDESTGRLWRFAGSGGPRQVSFSYCLAGDLLFNLRDTLFMGAEKVISVWFSTKGQVVLPARLRRQYEIKEGTRATVVATPEGILLKPITPATIRRGRGILKRLKKDKSWAQEWAEHQVAEKDLEDRHAR